MVSWPVPPPDPCLCPLVALSNFNQEYWCLSTVSHAMKRKIRSTSMRKNQKCTLIPKWHDLEHWRGPQRRLWTFQTLLEASATHRYAKNPLGFCSVWGATQPPTLLVPPTSSIPNRTFPLFYNVFWKLTSQEKKARVGGKILWGLKVQSHTCSLHNKSHCMQWGLPENAQGIRALRVLIRAGAYRTSLQNYLNLLPSPLSHLSNVFPSSQVPNSGFRSKSLFSHIWHTARILSRVHYWLLCMYIKTTQTHSASSWKELPGA